jgi:MFS family permease
LIFFRLVQGVGVGIVFTNGSAIVTDASPKKELGMMLGINQTAWRLGSVLGLTLSGLILALVDWRGLFYINIPVGIFGTLWAYRRLREISVKDPSRKMDWTGFLLFGIGLTLVLLAVTYLSYGASGLTEGFGLLLSGLALLAVFVMVELRVSSPLLDPKLFKIRSFAAANIAQVLNSLGWGGIILLLAFYLQVGLGYTPLQAGLGLVPLDGTYLLSSLIGGKLSDKYSARSLTTTGLVMNSMGFFLLSTFGEGANYSEFALVLVLIGVGNGLFTPPNLRAIMSSVPANRIGIASGFRNTMFNVGVTISYGLVILFLTFGIPYGTFSPLLEGTISQSLVSLAKEEFINGFRIATLLLTVIEVAAIVPSAMRASGGTVTADRA